MRSVGPAEASYDASYRTPRYRTALEEPALGGWRRVFLLLQWALWAKIDGRPPRRHSQPPLCALRGSLADSKPLSSRNPCVLAWPPFKQLPIYINSSLPSQTRNKLRNVQTTWPCAFHATRALVSLFLCLPRHRAPEMEAKITSGGSKDRLFFLLSILR